MRQILLGLVVGVILGVGIGSTLFSPVPVAHQPMPSVELGATRPIESSDLAALPELRPDSSRNAAPKLDLGEAPAFSNAELDEAISSTRAAPREQEVGPGVIRGRVMDTEGRPIASVLVRATRRMERGNSASDPSKVGVVPQDLSLERHLRDAAKEYAAGRSRSFEATSNASGEFALKGLQEGRYSISPYAEGYLLKNKAGRAGYIEARTGEEIELFGEAILDVLVSVRLADGTEVKNAIVRCSDHPIASGDDWSQGLFGSGRNEFTWSPDSPRLRLPAKTVYLKAFADPSSNDPSLDTNKVDFRSESVEVVLEPGTNPPTVTLSLEGRPGIRGRVIYPAERLRDSTPQVHLLAIPPGGDVNLEVLAEADPSVRLWRGSQHSFSFLDILPGRYAVGINRDWNAPIVVHEVIDVGADIVECELRLPPPDLDQFIQVTVLRPDGGMANQVSFGFTHRSGGSSSSQSGGSPMRTQEGVYLYSVPVNSNNAYYVEPSAEDEFLISVRAEGYSEMEALLSPGQRDLTIQFTEEAFLDVVVHGIAGTGLEGRLEIFMRPTLGGGGGTSRSSAGEDVSPNGEAHLEGLAVQRYRLTLRTQWRHTSPGNYQRGTDLMTTDVDLQPGANLIEITAPPVYTLEVLLEGTSEIRNISLTRVSPETGEVMESIAAQNTDERGLALFDQLPAGHYRVEAQGTESLEPFSVPCGPITLRAKE